MRPPTAQMLIEEGLVRFTEERAAELKYQRDERLSPRAAHFRPWLRRESNQLARAAEMPLPYPDEPDLREDNGERFLYDYYVEQKERERTLTYVPGMTRCPCASCVARRETCECDSCSSFRQLQLGSTGSSGLAAFIKENHEESYIRLSAASAEARRQDSGSRLGQQLGHLATLVRAQNLPILLDQLPRAADKGINVGDIVGYTAPAAPRETSSVVLPPTSLTNGLRLGCQTAISLLRVAPIIITPARLGPAFASSVEEVAAPPPTSLPPSRHASKRPRDGRARSDCPGCSCQKYEALLEENARRGQMRKKMKADHSEDDPPKLIRVHKGSEWNCLATCEQRIYLIAGGYQKE
jgi:hypothetical protein